jgi:hypothetical protein
MPEMSTRNDAWRPHELVAAFYEVARLAGTELSQEAVEVEFLPAPHAPPTKLPNGRTAVYVFSQGPEVLKVGKVGANSGPRYTHQHYNAGSAASTLAASVLADRQRLGCGDIEPGEVGAWIKQNVDRTNFLLDQRFGIPVLTLLEAYLQCRLRPRYEGHKSQREF